MTLAAPSSVHAAPLPQTRPPIEHKLKCWPEFFDEIAAGRKRHDLRHAHDRDFRVGDRLRLQEFHPDDERYTGRELVVEVTYVTSSDLPCALSKGALHPDFCILSLALLQAH